jgi:hypothetical protein
MYVTRWQMFYGLIHSYQSGLEGLHPLLRALQEFKYD